MLIAKKIEHCDRFPTVYISFDRICFTIVLMSLKNAS